MAIRYHARLLGVTSKAAPRWLPHEDAALREGALDIPGRTYEAILARRFTLGGVQPAKEIMKEVRLRMPTELPNPIRDEIAQEIVLAIYERRMRLIDIRTSIPNLVSQYYKRYPKLGAHLSLDAPAFEDGKTTIGDQIPSDAFRF